MSYILDALRKSEHERRVGAVPTLENTPFDNPEKSSQKPWIVILIATLICLNVGTLLVITVFNQEDVTSSIHVADQAPGNAEKTPTVVEHTKPSELVLNQTSPVQPSTTLMPEKTREPQPKTFPSPQRTTKTEALPTAQFPSAARPRSNVASKRTVQPTTIAKQTNKQNQTTAANHSKSSSNKQAAAKKPPLLSSALPQAQPNLSVSQPQVQKATPPADGNRKTVTQPAVTPPKPAVVAVSPQQPRSVSTPDTKQKTSLRPPAPAAPSRQPKHSDTHAITVQPKPPATEPRDTSIPLLSNMARDFQRQVPNLAINVFVYSETPGERFVIINMIKYKKGQKLRNGPLLEEIRSDSIVLNYRGRDFRLSRP